jgi:hypothetical protein
MRTFLRRFRWDTHPSAPVTTNLHVLLQNNAQSHFPILFTIRRQVQLRADNAAFSFKSFSRFVGCFRSFLRAGSYFQPVMP